MNIDQIKAEANPIKDENSEIGQAYLETKSELEEVCCHLAYPKQTWEQLQQDKIEARKNLLNLSPKVAQNLVNQTLYPEFWQLDMNDQTWEESIPTNYGQTDP